ncbi:TetR/AcrR family transcriptional regulator [Nonomuraea bangladeshensis]|uniref:TetR/AcrR family transcriptional regulator n=1 Tax=Nonomuraea bangladeshensis TaxID=404385 RepID=UPI003C2B9170
MTVAKNREPSRRYRSPLREEQARRTRTAVIDAATGCFVETGYVATTMKDIAARAGVSVETVYAQGNKASLLLKVVDRALAGDEGPETVLERPGMRGVLEASDPREVLRRLREILVAGIPYALPVMHAFQTAAAADPEIAEVFATYEERRLTDMTAIAEALAPGLRPGVTVAEAADVVWALFTTTAIRALVVDRDWGVERWASWVTDVLERTLLD